MDILKAEIARKRKLLEEKELLGNDKKYFKRGELIAKEQEEYRKKYYIQNEADESSSTVVEGQNIESDVQHSILPRSEVIIRLRDRSEPILLFGESELDAFKRLRKCELLEPEVNKGFRNDFQEAMEQVDQAYLNELFKETEGTKSVEKVDKSQKELTVDYEEIREMAKSMGRGNREHDMTVIVHFIQLMLKKWAEQLQNRSKEEKGGTKGKLKGATYAQTQEYLKPLLRKLKNFTLPEDISDSLTEIVVHLLERNYLKASVAFLQMAIGNAPWPIGVTMVGIHARTGREKIFSKNVAHVMNDETQRKYIQGLKRLMTKCQEIYPTDPSRCVEYQAFGKPEDVTHE
ncbi:pre-mRNA-splicing factor 18 [Diorhabda carinulata]|uniref:pre-mRNA-splicing factor 18 n=1 Tax=Diorhabda carinulata TaxID=1163345 RepID=UPI0025A188C7|nr:pre-mRNA-splicing factor 18 [Diorhabda carinulata]